MRLPGLRQRRAAPRRCRRWKTQAQTATTTANAKASAAYAGRNTAFKQQESTVAASGLWQSNVPDEVREPPKIDTSVPHVAQVYDYWLGGKDHFAADRETGDEAIRAYLDMRSSVQANRAFLMRFVRYLTDLAGIRQFLDIGTGLPSANNTHEVAQAAAPESRID